MNLQIPFPPKRDARVTREFFKDLFEENHFKRAEELAYRYIGKWMPVSGPLGPLWVKLDTFTISAQCRLIIQHRKYRGVAANRRFGPKGDIVAANDWVPLASNYSTRPALRRPSVSLSPSAGSLNGSRAK